MSNDPSSASSQSQQKTWVDVFKYTTEGVAPETFTLSITGLIDSQRMMQSASVNALEADVFRLFIRGLPQEYIDVLDIEVVLDGQEDQDTATMILTNPDYVPGVTQQIRYGGLTLALDQYLQRDPDTRRSIRDSMYAGLLALPSTQTPAHARSEPGDIGRLHSEMTDTCALKLDVDRWYSLSEEQRMSIRETVAAVREERELMTDEVYDDPLADLKTRLLCGAGRVIESIDNSAKVVGLAELGSGSVQLQV